MLKASQLQQGIIKVYPAAKGGAVTFAAPPPRNAKAPAKALAKALAKPPENASEPPPRVARILEELIAWRKRVNMRLQQEKVTKEFLQELLQEIRAARVGGGGGAASENKCAAPLPPSLPTLGEPTLRIRTTSGTCNATLYGLPERTSRVVDYVSPETVLQLYEPWTENSAGIWMRVKNGAWFQLWDRATNTYFAE